MMKRILMVLTVALLMLAFALPEAFAVPPGHNYNCPGFTEVINGTTTTVAGVGFASKGQANQFEKQYPGHTCTAG
jgi:hypothetical protein